ncbi:MAG: 16S rRNA (cytosine(1402)-N(4))-methyltransferase RsmH, partial [Elusimicrobiota bacterium]|nr:16S rRNA (cytosine(1402)-N(4))-methyltransferase RsmH [Elusimicrobiota bacterium]
MYHIPIMPSELSQLAVKNPNGLYIDATFGGGGHSLYLIEKYKDIKIIAFDCDAASFENFKNNESLFDGRVIFIRENFKNIAVSLSGIKVKKVDGIFADLGVSSKQFDDLSRGFSFNSPVLDMRMDERISLTAEELVNTYPPQLLADIFYKYGEEYRSRQIAQSIANRRVKRRLKSAADLCAAVEDAKKREGAVHPATKVFQALRIFINGELENLE